MVSSMIRIAIDMDEVLADTVSSLLDWYRDEFGYEWTRASLEGKGFNGIAPEPAFQRMRAMLHQGDFFETIPVMPGCQAVVEAMMARYEVFVASAAMDYPGSCLAKHRWLRRHFPFLPEERIVFCGDKSILRADYLIDDHARHFRRFGGQGVLFTSPHNIHVSGYPRVENWTQVQEVFVAAETPFLPLVASSGCH